MSASEESKVGRASACHPGEKENEERLLSAAAVIRESGAASPEALSAIVTATIGLYAASCEAMGVELCPVGREISTTEAMMLACALVRSQNLNPFDFALWFSTGR